MTQGLQLKTGQAGRAHSYKQANGVRSQPWTWTALPCKNNEPQTTKNKSSAWLATNTRLTPRPATKTASQAKHCMLSPLGSTRPSPSLTHQLHPPGPSTMGDPPRDVKGHGKAAGRGWAALGKSGIPTFVCLCFKSAVKACGRSIWDSGQDDGSVTLRHARPRVRIGKWVGCLQA